MTVRAAIITTTLSHFEVPMFRLAASLPGIEVHVFHLDLRDNAFFDSDYGTTIDWGENLRGGYPNTGFNSPGELGSAVLDWAPDVALMYGYFWKGALQILARLRIKRIPVVHRGLLTPYLNTRQHPVVTRVWRKLQPAFLRRFQAHHYGGDYSRQVLQTAKIPPNRQYFVPFSIDTPHFARQADNPDEAEKAAGLKRDLGWPETAPVLLFMCQHSWFKAPDVMIDIAAEAQKRMPEVKLIMAGSGRMTPDLQRLAAEKLSQGSFHFPGYVSSKQTMPLYLAASLVVFPSRYDTWSRGVNEAMLARRPCIVSRIVPAAGGLVEHNTNGYVVDGLDPNTFADHIVEFLNLPEDGQIAMTESARARAEEFSYEAHLDDLRRSFVECVR